MALTQSALLELCEAMRSADEGQLSRSLLQTRLVILRLTNTRRCRAVRE